MDSDILMVVAAFARGTARIMFALTALSTDMIANKLKAPHIHALKRFHNRHAGSVIPGNAPLVGNDDKGLSLNWPAQDSFTIPAQDLARKGNVLSIRPFFARCGMQEFAGFSVNYEQTGALREQSGHLAVQARGIGKDSYFHIQPRKMVMPQLGVIL